MNYLEIARRADIVAGLVFLALGGYSLWMGHDYLWTGVWFFSAAVSFISAKVVPARWLMSRMLASRFKV